MSKNVSRAILLGTEVLGRGAGLCLFGVAMLTNAAATCYTTWGKLLPAIRSRFGGNVRLGSQRVVVALLATLCRSEMFSTGEGLVCVT